jgi:hypothetical protein
MTRSHARWLFGAVALLVVAAGPAEAERPRVIKSVPEAGAQNVDYRITEIRVTFDQDMNRTQYSWVGGGPAFPKTTGQPRWEGKRTCVLPVKLEPDHDYWLSINSRTHKNFTNGRGEPAIPYPLQFSTRPDPNQQQKLGVDQNKLAIARLRKALREDYSYRDLRGIDWEKELARIEIQLRNSQTSKSFARKVAKLLETAQDIHISVSVDKSFFPTFRRNVPPNFNLDTVKREVPNFEPQNACVYTGQYKDFIGYILITTWSGQQEKELEAALKALERFKDMRGLIIDVRPNSGGDERIAQRFAGCFVSKPTPYAKQVIVDPNSPGGFTKPYTRTLAPNESGPAYRGRVAVLMGRHNMSSCEGFLLMMKRVPGAQLIGETSYGASGNPKPVDLGNGVVVRLPSWKAMTMEGNVVEMRGITPDIEVKAKPTDFEQSDPVLEAALKYLRK